MTKRPSCQRSHAATTLGLGPQLSRVRVVNGYTDTLQMSLQNRTISRSRLCLFLINVFTGGQQSRDTVTLKFNKLLFKFVMPTPD